MDPLKRSREDLEMDSDPRSESADGETMFVDSSYFPEGCEAGDKVAFIGQIHSLGEKYGIVVDKVKKVDDDDAYEADDE